MLFLQEASLETYFLVISKARRRGSPTPISIPFSTKQLVLILCQINVNPSAISARESTKEKVSKCQFSQNNGLYQRDKAREYEV